MNTRLVEGMDKFLAKYKDEKKAPKKLKESVDTNKFRVYAFNHDDPELVYIISNITSEQKLKLEDIFDYVEDISDLKGLYAIGNNDEEINYYDGSKYSSPKAWDMAIYQALVKDARENPDEETLFVPESECGIEIEIDKGDLNYSKYYITDLVNDSYVDRDSNYQYFFVRFTDNDAEYVRDYGNLYIYNSYEEYANENLEEEELDEGCKKPLNEDSILDKINKYLDSIGEAPITESKEEDEEKIADKEKETITESKKSVKKPVKISESFNRRSAHPGNLFESLNRGFEKLYGKVEDPVLENKYSSKKKK